MNRLAEPAAFVVQQAGDGLDIAVAPPRQGEHKQLRLEGICAKAEGSVSVLDGLRLFGLAYCAQRIFVAWPVSLLATAVAVPGALAATASIDVFRFSAGDTVLLRFAGKGKFGRILVGPADVFACLRSHDDDCLGEW